MNRFSLPQRQALIVEQNSNISKKKNYDKKYSVFPFFNRHWVEEKLENCVDLLQCHKMMNKLMKLYINFWSKKYWFLTQFSRFCNNKVLWMNYSLAILNTRVVYVHVIYTNKRKKLKMNRKLLHCDTFERIGQKWANLKWKEQRRRTLKSKVVCCFVTYIHRPHAYLVKW